MPRKLWRIAIDVPMDLDRGLRNELFEAIEDAVANWEPEWRSDWDPEIYAYPADEEV